MIHETEQDIINSEEKLRSLKLEFLKLLQMTLSSTKISNQVNLVDYVKQLLGFSSAEIVKIAQNVKKLSVINNIDKIDKKSFDKIINETIRFNENK